MQRTLLNLLIDLAAGLLFLALIATGYVIRFPLPPGTNKTLALWGLTRHQWGEIHFWISLGLLSVLAVHVILHWQWLVTVIRQRLNRPKRGNSRAGWLAALTVGGGFGLFAWAAAMSVRERPDPCCESTTETDDQPPTQSVSPPRREPTSPAKVAIAWKDVNPILERSCLSCHGPKKARGNFRIDRKEDFLAQRDGKAWVIPGDPDRSPLMRIVTGARTDIAFPDRHKLPESDAARLQAWIAAGAPLDP